MAARLKGSQLVYDSHEYFTEVPELVERPRVRRIWLAIERWIFPKLKHVVTVNDSIAKAYHTRYGSFPQWCATFQWPVNLDPCRAGRIWDFRRTASY